jgi:hypothetical protein
MLLADALEVHPQSEEVAIAQSAGKREWSILYPIERENAEARPLMLLGRY